MATSRDDKKIITLHRPGLREKLFFFISGFIISVPLTLYVGSFTDYLCTVLPIFYATVCSTAIFTPFIEAFAKAYFSNNFSALFGLFWFIGGVAAVAIAYLLSWRLYHKTSERFVG